MTVIDPLSSKPVTDDWFRTLAETTATAIFVYDETHLLYANRAAEELSGYSMSELQEMSPEELVHPDDLERIRERLERRRRGESVSPRVELKILTKTGYTRWLEIAANGLEVGGRVAVLGSAVDITDRRQAEGALRESEERYRQIFEKNRAVKLLLDPANGRIVEATPSAAEFYGYSREELTQMHIWDINVLPEKESRETLRQARQEECNHFLFQHRLASGEIRTVEVDSSPIDVQGRKLLYAIIHDITDHERAQAALRQEQERAQVTLASIGDGVIRTDAQGCIDYLNPVAQSLTGWSDEEARGHPLHKVFRVVDEGSREPLEDPVQLCLGQEDVVELPGSALLIRRDGSEFAVRDTVAPIRDPDGVISGAVLVFKDVTRLQGLERRMSYLARHDLLTGVLNRGELERRVHKCLVGAREKDRHHALLYLDLDDLKVVNDTAGHLAGDEVLRRVARVLQETVREWDTVARLGSDEFGILLVDVTSKQARELAEAIRSAVDALRLPWESQQLRVGASVGLVYIDANSAGVQELLRSADTACHIAKEQGRGRVHEFHLEDTAIAERSGALRWLARLHRALDEEQFALARQAIRPLREGLPPMYELLLRLPKETGGTNEEDDPGGPEAGWVTSKIFFPAAERYRLAPSLDRWVARQTFQRLAHETPASETEALRYTINLSGQSLSDESFLPDVEEMLDESGVDPRRLCFEITETAAIAHLPQATRFISALRQRGCRFVLDDFGSGLSSFAYLRNLQVDFLKIDQIFVRGMSRSRVQRAMVKAMRQLGHDLGITTIAEGVETQESFEALGEIGVDYAQGYWLSRPRIWSPEGDPEV